MVRMLRTGALAIGALLLAKLAADACNSPPCSATSALVAAIESKTVQLEDGSFSVFLDMNLTNGTVDCPAGVPFDLFVNAKIEQTDSYADFVSHEFLELPKSFGLFHVPASSTQSGMLRIDFPASAAAGLRQFKITLTAQGITKRVVRPEIYLLEDFEVQELMGNLCLPAGTPGQKIFRITNHSAQAKIFAIEVTSQQNASAAFIRDNVPLGDHYPIAFCGQALPAGDPYDTTIPRLVDTVQLPAGEGSFVDVCIQTYSFPACHPGSNCEYAIKATDLVTGDVGGAATALTAVTPTWNSCHNPVLTSPVSGISVATGGTQPLVLDAGPDAAGDLFFLMGSLHGTQPSSLIESMVGPAVPVPLTSDEYHALTFGMPGAAPISTPVGLLDSVGRATSAIVLGGTVSPALVGLMAHHAYLVVELDGPSPEVVASSNAFPLTLVF